MLKNEIVLVTGASRGIGQSIAIELGLNGAKVIGTSTSEQGARQIDDELRKKIIENSKETVKEFSLSLIAKKHYKIFKKIIEN